MEVQTESAGGLDSRCELLPEGSVPLDVAATVSVNDLNDFTSYDESIMDEIDSYMEDLNGRLKVSRMVTDSVIKGIVSAIEEECAEKISLNEERMSIFCSELLNHDSVLANKYLIDQLFGTQQNYEANAISSQETPEFIRLMSQPSSRGHIDFANGLRVKVEEWIQKLEEEVDNAKRTNLSQADALCLEVGQCRYDSQIDAIYKFNAVDINSLETLLKEMSSYLSTIIYSGTLAFKQESEKGIPIVISNSLLHNLTGLLHEYEAKILDQKTLMIDFIERMQKKFNELASLRQELDGIGKSLISWESGTIFPHINHESLEERNVLKKDQVQRKAAMNNTTSREENSLLAIKKDEVSEEHSNADSSKLMCMSKEELINHFKNEMVKMNRQHDAVLQEKTENLFSLKRELLKEKGCYHLNFRKDKEAELVRRRISNVISKLDDILLENENLSTIHDEESLCSLREKVDVIFLENQHLLSLLVAKMKETVPDCSVVLHTANQLPNLFVGVEYLDQIEELQGHIEVLKFEASMKDAINTSVLQELHVQLGDRIEGMEMDLMIGQRTYSFIVGEVVRDILSRVSTVMMNCFEEKKYISENLLDKENALFVEVEENKILKQQIESSSASLKNKEILVSNLEDDLVNMRGHLDSICHECDVLRDQIRKKELVIVENKMEAELINCTLKENSYQIHQQQAEIDEIHQNLQIVSVALRDSEKQKNIHRSELLEIQAKLASEMTKEKHQRKLVESILASMSKFEFKVDYIIEHNVSRLNVLSYQCNELSKQAGLFKKNLLWYKEIFEIRCEDLKKAETEVDLLGDEVDKLVSLLGKIYLNLEHYSPVLQHYPGVMETLKLIRKEVTVEARKSF